MLTRKPRPRRPIVSTNFFMSSIEKPFLTTTSGVENTIMRRIISVSGNVDAVAVFEQRRECGRTAAIVVTLANDVVVADVSHRMHVHVNGTPASCVHRWATLRVTRCDTQCNDASAREKP